MVLLYIDQSLGYIVQTYRRDLLVFCFASNSLKWSLQGLGFCSFVCFLSLSIREASRIQRNGPDLRNGIKQGLFQEKER